MKLRDLPELIESLKETEGTSKPLDAISMMHYVCHAPYRTNLVTKLFPFQRAQDTGQVTAVIGNAGPAVSEDIMAILTALATTKKNDARPRSSTPMALRTRVETFARLMAKRVSSRIQSWKIMGTLLTGAPRFLVAGFCPVNRSSELYELSIGPLDQDKPAKRIKYDIRDCDSIGMIGDLHITHRLMLGTEIDKGFASVVASGAIQSFYRTVFPAFQETVCRHITELVEMLRGLVARPTSPESEEDAKRLDQLVSRHVAEDKSVAKEILPRALEAHMSHVATLLSEHHMDKALSTGGLASLPRKSLRENLRVIHFLIETTHRFQEHLSEHPPTVGPPITLAAITIDEGLKYWTNHPPQAPLA